MASVTAATNPFKGIAPPEDPEDYIKWRVANQPKMIDVGNVIPNENLHRCVTQTTREFKKSHEWLSKGVTLLVTVPSAHSPTCDNQLPQFITSANRIKELGVDKIIFVAPNSTDVVRSWAEFHKIGEDVLCLADPYQRLIIKMGLGFDFTGERTLGLGARRCALLIEQPKDKQSGNPVPTVVHRILETDPTKPVNQCAETSAQKVVEWLEARQKAKQSSAVTTNTAAK